MVTRVAVIDTSFTALTLQDVARSQPHCVSKLLNEVIRRVMQKIAVPLSKRRNP
jgi:hypothetical protein